MIAKQLLDLTRAWHDSELELKQLRALFKIREKQIEVIRGEMKALQVDNTQLRYELLCPKCRNSLASKQPGDTILALPCLSCIGTEGYTKNWGQQL